MVEFSLHSIVMSTWIQAVSLKREDTLNAQPRLESILLFLVKITYEAGGEISSVMFAFRMINSCCEKFLSTCLESGDVTIIFASYSGNVLVHAPCSIGSSVIARIDQLLTTGHCNICDIAWYNPDSTDGAENSRKRKAMCLHSTPKFPTWIDPSVESHGNSDFLPAQLTEPEIILFGFRSIFLSFQFSRRHRCYCNSLVRFLALIRFIWIVLEF